MAAGGLAAVVALPDMADERALAVVRLMDRVIMAGYCAGRIRLVHLLTLRMLALVLEWGHSAVSCLALPLYASFFQTRLKRYEQGYALGRAALQIMDRFQDQTRRGQFNVTMATAVAHWKGSLEVRFGVGLLLFGQVAADVPLSSSACALLQQSG